MLKNSASRRVALAKTWRHGDLRQPGFFLDQHCFVRAKTLENLLSSVLRARASVRVRRRHSCPVRPGAETIVMRKYGYLHRGPIESKEILTAQAKEPASALRFAPSYGVNYGVRSVCTADG